jgi:DNA repair protein RadD
MMARMDITDEALDEAIIAAKDRKHWLIFATGIEHVEMTVQLLRQKGISAAAIHSKMPDKERDENLRSFIKGEIRALVNADILTTGFDFEALDCIILLRATSSPGLHVQILGRGTRPYFGKAGTPEYGFGFDLETIEGRLGAIAASPKQNCLILDFAGNTRRLGPINDPRIPNKKNPQPGDVPVKVCQICQCLNHISARICINCGAEFPINEKLESRASTIELISRDQPKVEVFKVDHVTYAPHYKRGSPTSLKVSYHCGLLRFSEWVCLEHLGPIRYKAQQWWTDRTQAPVPQSIDEAVPYLGTLKVPDHVRVWINKKYPQVMSHIFEGDK